MTPLQEKKTPRPLKYLKKIVAYRSLSYEEFEENLIAQDIVEYNLFQIANHILDMIEHIVVDEDYGFPQSSYEATLVLFEKKVIDNEDLSLLKKMIGFRNVIGHDYISIDKRVVYSILTEKENDIKKIILPFSEKRDQSEVLRKKIIEILDQNLDDDYILFIFGSFARGKIDKSSDIDLAIYGTRKISSGVLVQVKDDLERNLGTLRDIDIVDLTDKNVGIKLLENILKESVIWRKSKSSKELLKNLKKRLKSSKK